MIVTRLDPNLSATAPGARALRCASVDEAVVIAERPIAFGSGSTPAREQLAILDGDDGRYCPIPCPRLWGVTDTDAPELPAQLCHVELRGA